MFFLILTEDVEVRLAPDGLVVVGRPHLALVVGVVRQAHVPDLEAELAAAVTPLNAVTGEPGD